MLIARDLVVCYRSIEALHGISIEISRGEIVALIGANGAGKSTTLRTISALLRPRSGRVEFEGRPIVGLPPHRLVGMGIGHVPEGRGIFSNLSVEENLMLGGYGRSDRSELARDREHALELFPRVRERLRQQAGTLSGGEQQMLAIARALLARPRLLLLDEPSLGLAPQLVSLIFSIIRRINQQGTTILLIEQNARMALTVATRAYVLQTGSIVKSGPAREMLHDPDVRKAYLGG
jgi:branched-chain amino acid transport system ATP-binding protein